jgi:enoyl-CoA hydratase
LSLVTLERGDGVAVLTLNRPEAMNALSQALQRDLAEAILEVGEDQSVRAVVLTGAGERAFSAGLDLKEVGAYGLGKGPEGPRGKDPVKILAACAKPVIGAINGVAITGGFELALTCDILIASSNARFADTHARVGVTPGWGLSQRLSRVIGPYRAKELSLSGNFLDAQTALAWGLVNRVVEPAQLLPAAKALAADIASCDPDMIKRYKALIDDGFNLAFGAAMALELERSAADNAKVTPESVAERRAGVQARGRDQKA